MRHLALALLLGSAATPSLAQDDGPSASPLDPLAWIVGEWTDQSGDKEINLVCNWSGNRSFITRQFTVRDKQGAPLMEGTQVIGWDADQQRFRSWTFDSEGGFGESYWTQDGDRWLIKKTFTLNTGERASALNVLTRVDDNTATWSSHNREIGGRMMPSQPEVTIVRRNSQAEEASDE